MGCFKKINAFLVFSICFRKTFHSNWCLDKIVWQIENDLERGFVKYWLHYVYIFKAKQQLYECKFVNYLTVQLRPEMSDMSLNFKFTRGPWEQEPHLKVKNFTAISFSIRTLPSAPTKSRSFKVTGRLGIIPKKFERTQSQFISLWHFHWCLSFWKVPNNLCPERRLVDDIIDHTQVHPYSG